jgi:hypothetical protein
MHGEDRPAQLINRCIDCDPRSFHRGVARRPVEILSCAQQVLHRIVVQGFGQPPPLAFLDVHEQELNGREYSERTQPRGAVDVMAKLRTKTKA